MSDEGRSWQQPFLHVHGCDCTSLIEIPLGQVFGDVSLLGLLRQKVLQGSTHFSHWKVRKHLLKVQTLKRAEVFPWFLITHRIGSVAGFRSFRLRELAAPP